MSQVDKVNFLVNLFWFILFFIMIYFIIFLYFIPLTYQAIRVRSFFYEYIIKKIKGVFYLSVLLEKKTLKFNFFKKIKLSFFL